MADRFSSKNLSVSKEAVKLCALCGTLNHQHNADCWTCGWHGEFSRDAHTISLAWRRLESRYEQVGLEHLTARKVRALGDFGATRPRSRWQTAAEGCRAWWQNFQAQRDLRAAQRQTRLRSQSASRPDQLGV